MVRYGYHCTRTHHCVYRSMVNRKVGVMRVIRINKFVQEEDNFEWLIDGLLPSVGWTLFYGLRSIGKTTFAMQMCTALQDGTDFLGRKVKQRNIMYIQADSLAIEWKQMLKRIAPKSTGFTVVDVPERCLGNPEYCSRIQHYIEQCKPGFLVFDSLYNLTAWPINTEAVLMPVNIIKAMVGNLPWMLIHHPPHDANRAAGHHSLGANCSQEWCLLKTRLKIEKGRILGDAEVIQNKAIPLSRDEKGLWVYKDESGGADVDPYLQRKA
jgi:RecA-family ATPase